MHTNIKIYEPHLLYLFGLLDVEKQKNIIIPKTTGISVYT